MQRFEGKCIFGNDYGRGLGFVFVAMCVIGYAVAQETGERLNRWLANNLAPWIGK